MQKKTLVLGLLAAGTIATCAIAGAAAAWRPLTYKATAVKASSPELPDFTLTDIDGKEVKLSSLRGKFVYLDFWATWCKPCMAEMPDARKLQTEMKGKDITWVFISLDQIDEKWRKAVKNNRLEGIHVRGGDQLDYLKKEFNFNELPFYIWIGKDGKVLLHNAPRPSEAGTARKLKKYISRDSGE